jgi:hypothetical protein
LMVSSSDSCTVIRSAARYVTRCGTNETLWVPNRSSVSLTCGIAGQ